MQIKFSLLRKMWFSAVRKLMSSPRPGVAAACPEAGASAGAYGRCYGFSASVCWRAKLGGASEFKVL